MKNYFVLLLMCAFIVVGNAQNEYLEKFCDQYDALEDVFHLKLSGGMLNLAISEDGAEKDLLERISAVRMLFMGEAKMGHLSEVKQLEKQLKKSDYEDLMHIKDGGTKLAFMIRENETHITDVLLLFKDEASFGIISVEGLFKFSDLNEIDINMEGGDYFKKIPKKRKDIPRA